MPLDRFMELSVLAKHPPLWDAVRGGRLDEVPERLVRELWLHARAEQADLARAVARELVAALLKCGVLG